MPRRIPDLIRQIVLASLPALVSAGATMGCSDGGGSGDALDGGGDTTNCGMCGCGFNPARTQTVPYRPSCDAGVRSSDAETDADETSGDGSVDADAAATGDVGADSPSADACEDPSTTTLNCSYQCPAGGAGGYGFPSSCRLLPGEASLLVECTYVMPCGRRPAGLERETESHARDAIGRHLAESAFLEAASVEAFAILARELARHGAPASLVRQAKRAARDEVRHARAMRGLSLRFGATPARAQTVVPRDRSLEALAVENVIEGCVRETYGAAMAAWQGERAGDRATRRVMKRIARDEARHADLSWSVSRWAARRLDVAARARLARARARAVATLRAELAKPADPRLVHLLGVPDLAAASELANRLDAALWSRRDELSL